MKTKKKFGWVRFDTEDKKFVTGEGYVSKTIRKALVFPSRILARDRKSGPPFRLRCDAVLKVELTQQGRAKEVVGRG